MQLDIKALQDDVEDEKAEKETPIHVGLPMLLCSITISIPRLQTLLNKSYWHLLFVSLLWQKHYNMMLKL